MRCEVCGGRVAGCSVTGQNAIYLDFPLSGTGAGDDAYPIVVDPLWGVSGASLRKGSDRWLAYGRRLARRRWWLSGGRLDM
ncbi:hypothetical protein SAMN02745716_1216 [Thermoleophilum album]|uniref:Uncharacterized protein n=1 Tax=Thermoleophilum album TaxID=29539 RepID=A0A1H6FPM4_THEAL|nr:hypothetical protein SAMN02745716_1216 [Thermoleophilum album]